MTAAKQDDGVNIRLATAADAERANAFHNAYYRTHRMRRQWEWEFCRGAAADAALPFALAEFEGRVVGTQALIVIDMVDRNGTFATAKSEETLVDPSMRGRSLFARLYDPLLQYAQAAGVRSIWGFTPARSAFERAGFEVPATTSQIARLLRAPGASALAEGRRKKPLQRGLAAAASVGLSLYAGLRASTAGVGASGIDLDVLDDSPSWADDLTHRFVAQWGGVTIMRSQSYLRWRIFENPYVRPIFISAAHAGEPVGFACLAMVENRVAMLVDIMAIDARAGTVPAESTIAALLRTCVTRARHMGAVALRGWSVTDHPFDLAVRRVARRLGWLHFRRGNDMIYRILAGKPPGQARWSVDDWYISRIYTEGPSG